MRSCKAILLAAIFVLAAAGTAPLWGEESALVNGEVTRIDEPAGKIAVKHGPIPSLSMNEDGKTDDFRPKDGLLFNALRAGDKIRFAAERVNGELTLTRVEKQ